MPKMNDFPYWAKREAELDKAMESDERALFKRLKRTYNAEMKTLDKEVSAFYRKYSRNDVLQYRALLETLPDDDVRLLYRDLEEFRKKYPEYSDVIKISTDFYKLNRLEGLKYSILLEQAELYAKEYPLYSKHFLKIAKKYANLNGSALGFGTNFYTENSVIIRSVVGAKWASGQDFSTSLWGNREKLANYLINDFSQAVARGDSYNRIIKQMMKQFDTSTDYTARRLVYTEDTFIREQINKRTFEPYFSEYQYNCMAGACEKCTAINGKKFTFDTATPGTNYPPMHPWCRCYITVVLPETEEERVEWINNYSRNAPATADPENVLKKLGANL